VSRPHTNIILASRPPKRHYTPPHLTPEEVAIVSAYIAQHSDWLGDSLPSDLIDALNSRYSEKVLTSLVKKAYVGIKDGLSTGVTPVSMSDDADDERLRMAMLHTQQPIAPSAAVATAMQQQAQARTSSGPSPITAPPSPPPTAADTARRAIFSWKGPVIGHVLPKENYYFWVLAPIFPYADGPTMAPTFDGRAIKVTWRWRAESTLDEGSLRHPHAPPFNYMDSLGEEGNVHDWPGGTIDIVLPVPGAYTVSSPVSVPNREPHQQWMTVKFLTNWSGARRSALARLACHKRPHDEDAVEPTKLQ